MTDEEFYAQLRKLISRNISEDDPEMVALLNERANSTKNANSKEATENLKYKESTNNAHPYISEDKFREAYLKLLSQNVSEDDPEMIALLEQRAESQKIHNNNKLDKKNKSHIIIDTHGNYFLLDSKLQIIDTIYTNPILNIITKKHNLRTFRKQLNSDFKKYKKHCKKSNITMDSDFVNMHKAMKYYLKLCPDADYNILDLIRLNFYKMDSSYENYQSMCAEYLHELAKTTYGNLDNMPFGIYFSTDDYVTNNHKYISYQFDGKSNPVETFRNIYYQKNGNPYSLEDYRCYDAIGKYNPQFTHIRNIQINSFNER